MGCKILMTQANKKFQQLQRRVHSIKTMSNERQSRDVEINTDEHTCQKCGFKARYKFLRCPECEAVQK